MKIQTGKGPVVKYRVSICEKVQNVTAAKHKIMQQKGALFERLSLRFPEMAEPYRFASL